MCFLFSLLSMRVLLASAASWFQCVAVLSLYDEIFQVVLFTDSHPVYMTHFLIEFNRNIFTLC